MERLCRRAIWLVALMALLGGCTRMVLQPDRVDYPFPLHDRLGTEEFTITTPGEPTLHGWRFPARGERRATLLFLHGNAQNLSAHAGFVHWLPEHGFEVYIVDYRGYGRSEGEADLEGAVEDVGRALRFTAAEADEPVVVLGHSLGAALAITAVARMEHPPVRALIAAAPFSAYRQVAREVLGRGLLWPLARPLSWTIDDSLSPIDFVAALEGIPLYLLYSEADGIIDPAHARRLFEAAGKPKRLVALKGGHNHFLRIEANRATLLGILDEITSAAPADGYSARAADRRDGGSSAAPAR